MTNKIYRVRVVVFKAIIREVKSTSATEAIRKVKKSVVSKPPKITDKDFQDKESTAYEIG